MAIEIGFLTSDLFFPMKIKSCVEQHGGKMRLARDFAQLAGKIDSADNCPLILVDLTTASGLNDLTRQTITESFPTAQTVAFGPHVDRETLQSAADKFDDVMPRSKFDVSFPGLIAQACRTHS